MIRPKRARLWSVHGLHRRTVGKVLAWAFYLLLLPRLQLAVRRGRPIIAGGDFNDALRRLARWVGAGVQWYGHSPDGFLIYGVDVIDSGIDTTATDSHNRWSDHPAVWIKVRLADGTVITLVTANLNKDATAADHRRYLAYLRANYDVLFLQEYGRGLRSTRLVGRLVIHGRRLTVGKRGAHRGVARGWLDLTTATKETP